MPEGAPARVAVEALAAVPAAAHKKIMAHCRVMLNLGPGLRAGWFKQLQEAKGILQLTSDEYRLWVFSHPRRPKTYVLLSCHVKRAAKTSPAQLRHALQTYSQCVDVIEREGRK
jgi:hypothetical protein